MQTKEPDGGRLGLDVRALLIRDRAFVLDGVEELLLVAAARRDHVRSVICPALADGQWVLSDRFADSTFALQVWGKGAPAELYTAVMAVVVGDLWPDLTFILDIDPEQARFRRERRISSAVDPAERTRDFERIREGFRLVAQTEPGRCRLVDAAQHPKVIARLPSGSDGQGQTGHLDARTATFASGNTDHSGPR